MIRSEVSRTSSAVEQVPARNYVYQVSFLPQERVAEMHSAAHITILTVRAGYSDASVPSKLIRDLEAGRPILFSAYPDSTVARTVRESGAGIVAEPRDAGAIAATVRYLADHPSLGATMGLRAHKYFKTPFTVGRAREQFTELFRSLGFREFNESDKDATSECGVSPLSGE